MVSSGLGAARFQLDDAKQERRLDGAFNITTTTFAEALSLEATGRERHDAACGETPTEKR
jgi:alpha-D-ribose 1-methylphosphonate 5-triphosphate diphosphatase PhnM